MVRLVSAVHVCTLILIMSNCARACMIGVTVLVEPKALFHIVGTTMDWEDTALSSEFVFNNPNAKSMCGCGESFNTE